MTSTEDISRPGAAAFPGPPGDPRRGSRRPGLATGVILAVWAGGIVLAILAGAFDRDDGPARLAMPAAVVIPVAAVAVLFRVSPRFREYLLALDLRLVVAAQLWRVVGIAFLFALAFGELPAGFAVPAGVGDIATGIAALAAVAALDAGTLTRRRLYAFTALGLTDFLVAFVTGPLLAPPALTQWPLAIFPTFMVPFFIVLHLVAVLQRSQVEPS